jgi:hypothetical protein
VRICARMTPTFLNAGEHLVERKLPRARLSEDTKDRTSNKTAKTAKTASGRSQSARPGADRAHSCRPRLLGQAQGNSDVRVHVRRRVPRPGAEIARRTQRVVQGMQAPGDAARRLVVLAGRHRDARHAR